LNIAGVSLLKNQSTAKGWTIGSRLAIGNRRFTEKTGRKYTPGGSFPSENHDFLGAPGRAGLTYRKELTNSRLRLPTPGLHFFRQNERMKEIHVY
jgi:hypothetical protein